MKKACQYFAFAGLMCAAHQSLGQSSLVKEFVEKSSGISVSLQLNSQDPPSLGIDVERIKVMPSSSENSPADSSVDGHVNEGAGRATEFQIYFKSPELEKLFIVSGEEKLKAHSAFMFSVPPGHSCYEFSVLNAATLKFSAAELCFQRSGQSADQTSSDEAGTPARPVL